MIDFDRGINARVHSDDKDDVIFDVKICEDQESEFMFDNEMTDEVCGVEGQLGDYAYEDVEIEVPWPALQNEFDTFMSMDQYVNQYLAVQVPVYEEIVPNPNCRRFLLPIPGKTGEAPYWSSVIVLDIEFTTLDKKEKKRVVMSSASWPGGGGR